MLRPEWSFGWNHDQTTELTVPQLVFPDHLDILRTIVEPDLSWVVKNPKTDMHSYPADHPDSPACVLLLTALDTAISEGPFAFSDHIQHPVKVILQFMAYQVVPEPLWLKQRNQRKRQNKFDDDEKMFEKNSKKVLNKNEFSGPLNAFDIGAYMTLVLEALCQYMKGQMKNKTVVIKQTKTDFLPFKSWTKLKVSNVLIMILLLITLFLLMFHLFEEGVNDAPQSMEPARHGDQDVLNDSTEVRPSDSTNQTNRAVYRIDLHSSKMEFRLKPRSDDQTDRTTTRFSRPPDILRTIVEPDLSWIVKNPKTDMHSHPANHPDSPACALLLTALDTTSSDEPRQ
ncbi:hypothetical protein IGI04_036504 [Brassica rapa subsp. trilocularis]|uniref:Uncharacterized protein n=1 Tax=Brassica rapa subsp. trilocularis TaxID=1813537 RepID=A0ABQ7LHN9_BRACM|nr:hypothetical protein IGI04_036504 [Brassica rapa subsp. trilocularis]